jgi:hypothetical protein
MQSKESRRYEMLVRVRDFGQKHQHLFPESAVSGQAFAAVAASVDQLCEHVVSALETTRERNKVREEARAKLVEVLDAIVRTGRILAEEQPGTVNTFRLPKKRSDRLLVAIGRGFIRDAEALKASFMAHGMPATFVADLTGLVDRFEAALRDREESRSSKAAVNTGIAQALKTGVAAVRKLDVIIANQLKGDDSTLSAWERERRVEGVRGGRGGSATREPAPVPEATPTIVVAPAVGGGPASIAPSAVAPAALPVTPVPVAMPQPSAGESAKPAADAALKVAS